MILGLSLCMGSMEAISHYTQWRQYRIIHNGGNIALYTIEAISHYTQWRQYRIIHNGGNIALYTMEAISHYTQWWQYRIIHNGGNIALYTDMKSNKRIGGQKTMRISWSVTRSQSGLGRLKMSWPIKFELNPIRNVSTNAEWLSSMAFLGQRTSRSMASV